MTDPDCQFQSARGDGNWSPLNIERTGEIGNLDCQPLRALEPSVRGFGSRSLGPSSSTLTSHAIFLGACVPCRKICALVFIMIQAQCTSRAFGSGKTNYKQTQRACTQGEWPLLREGLLDESSLMTKGRSASARLRSHNRVTSYHCHHHRLPSVCHAQRH